MLANLIETAFIIYPYWAKNEEIKLIYAKLGVEFPNTNNSIYPVCMCLYDNINLIKQLDCKKQNKIEEIKSKHCTEFWPFNLIELDSATSSFYLNKHWLPNYQNQLLILDIDEDFFGVQMVSQDLIKTNLNFSFVKNLNEFIEKYFCLKHPSDELNLDKWFLNFLNYMQNNDYNKFNNILNKLNLNAHLWLCNSNISTLNLLNKLIYKFKNVTITNDQWNCLAKIGICLIESPYTFETNFQMHLCLGHNMPNFSIIEEYVPNLNEIKLLSIHLTEIIKKLPQKPDLITICRSSRDGYTPRSMQSSIEYLILNILKKEFNLDNNTIFYEPYLAGNKKGWELRYA